MSVTWPPPKVSGRAVRREVGGLAQRLEETEQAVQAALGNELQTRHRVDVLEAWRMRTLRGRLTWLLFGR